MPADPPTTRPHRAPFARAACAALFVALGAAACGGHTTSDSSQALAEDGTDASEVESASASLAAAFSLSTTRPTELAEVLSAAPKTRAFFLPLGCLTTTVTPSTSTVVHTFNDCTGPWGLVHVTGSITVVYSATTTAAGAAGLKAELSTDSLKVRRATVAFHDTAILTANGADREMTWDSDLHGTTARARAISRKATWDVKWTVGDACLLANGTADGDVAGRELITTLTNYERCRGECPADGGKITIRNPDSGDQIAIVFNGGNHATFQGTNGATTEVTLACAL